MNAALAEHELADAWGQGAGPMPGQCHYPARRTSSEGPAVQFEALYGL